MIHLLDTSICILYLNGTDARVRDRLCAVGPDGARLCSVVKAELLYGARKSLQVGPNLSRLAAFFALLKSWDLDDRAADHYGVLRTQLEREGTPIGGNDMMIAAIALANDATLATRNAAEFARVAGLRWTDWTD